MDGTISFTKEYVNSLVGLYVDEAANKVKQSNGRTRVTRVDGLSFVLTLDYRTDRVNFHVETGKITRAYVG